MRLNTFLGLSGLLPYPSRLAPLPPDAAPPPAAENTRRIHMPLSGIGSYITTGQAFSEHWSEVNTALGAGGPLVLPGPYALAAFDADIDALQAAIAEVIARDNDRQIAAGTRDQRKAALAERMKQFRAAVQGVVVAPGYVNALPTLPTISSAPSKFLDPFSDMEELWTQINAAAGVPGFTPPLTLGSYALAAFSDDLDGMADTFEAASRADQAATIARRKRDELMAALKGRMQQYHRVVIARLGTTDPLSRSLPALTPPPGSTPDAVALSAAWDAGLSMAHLAWPASTDARLAGYSVRGCAGGGYKTAGESVIASLQPGQTSLNTDWGLAAAGSQAAFKVYVVTETGNEKGSNAVAITRPA